MSLTKKIAYNTIIQFIGKAMGTVIGVLTIAIMTRYLGQIGFGQYSTATAYLQFFAILVDMGLSLTVIKLITEPGLEKNQAMNNIFTFRFFTALIFLGLAPLAVIFFPYDNLVKICVAIISLSFFISSLNQILISLFQKELKLAGVAISEVAGRLVLLGLVAYFAYADMGLVALVWAVVLGSLMNFCLNYLFALKFVKIKFSFDWAVWKKIIQITWPLALSIALNLVYFKADTLILSLTRSQAEVGIYNAPYRILEILVNFIYLFVGIIFPILTAAWTEKNYQRFRDIFQKTFDALLIISLPMIFGTGFVATKLMLLIAGPEFLASGDILRIIIVATAIIFINSLFGYTIVTLDKQKNMVWAYLAVAGISLIGYLITIPRYGYYGAAIFTVFSEALILIFNFIVTVKTVKFYPSLSIIYKILLSSGLMCIVLYFLANYNVILQICLASISYFIFIYLFKGVSSDFIEEIIQNKNKREQPIIDNKL